MTWIARAAALGLVVTMATGAAAAGRSGGRSGQLGRPERTVFRVLDRVKKRLRRLCDEDAGSA